MKSRTRARHLALQFLYQVDLLGQEKIEDLTAFLKGEEKPGDARTYARHLVEGTLEARESLDGTIQSVAQNWDISRMAVIDRNVLRLASVELLKCDDIPPNVAINEAIELAKKYMGRLIGLRNGALQFDLPVAAVTDAMLQALYEAEGLRDDP